MSEFSYDSVNSINFMQSVCVCVCCKYLFSLILIFYFIFFFVARFATRVYDTAIHTNTRVVNGLIEELCNNSKTTADNDDDDA